MDLKNSNKRKAVSRGKNSITKYTEMSKYKGFFGTPKPVCVTRVHRVGAREGVRRHEKEDRVRDEGGTRP